jgi:hypothetical protein
MENNKLMELGFKVAEKPVVTRKGKNYFGMPTLDVINTFKELDVECISMDLENEKVANNAVTAVAHAIKRNGIEGIKVSRRNNTVFLIKE